MSATITVRGGAADVEVERLTVLPVVRVETQGDHEARFNDRVDRIDLEKSFTLRAGEVRTERASFDIPSEMPLTHFDGRPLNQAYSAVITELAIDNAVDRGDEDPLEVHSLPSQATVLRPSRTSASG